jgi:hypothetical protein
MSDALKHECGIAHIRLLKPLEYYKKKYGTGTKDLAIELEEKGYDWIKEEVKN